MKSIQERVSSNHLPPAMFALQCSLASTKTHRTQANRFYLQYFHCQTAANLPNRILHAIKSKNWKQENRNSFQLGHQ